MTRIIDIGVEKDHIESLTKSTGTSSLAELIWNSLDADSSEIKVEFNPSKLDGFESIIIRDNGHGLTYEKAQTIFSRIGGSEKKINSQSPKGRQYHGKEGKGRYKSLALGDLVIFKSNFEKNNELFQFTITIDKNQLSNTKLSGLTKIDKTIENKGFSVEIYNVNNKTAAQAFKAENRKDLEEKFASYWISYQNFKIYINNKEFEFASLIKNSAEIDINIEEGDKVHGFKIKILEWNFENKKKTYLCNAKGIPFLETTLGIRSTLPISIFIQSEYIEKLHRESVLDLFESDQNILSILKTSKDFARDYIRTRLHYYSKEFIEELKSKGIYPYQEPTESIVEVSKRQIFDIIALQVHEYLPSFNELDDKGKKLTLSLLSKALENDSNNLRKILNEILELPQEQRDDLAELLDSTSLSSVIDAMSEIKNRLTFLNGLEQIIYNSELNKNILERKHLHKIIVEETWIFGDEYTYGVDDLTLKNVLKAYLKECLNRDDFETTVNSQDNSELETIPDVCLWQQYSLGSAGKENLIIELKRPSLNAGLNEMSQILSYASKVSNDSRFPKEKTKWKFYLITKEISRELEPQLNQNNRRYGHISNTDNFDVFILTWGDIISEAKNRHDFIKEKLNFNLKDNEEGLEYLKSKYKKYLPSEF